MTSLQQALSLQNILLLAIPLAALTAVRVYVSFRSAAAGIADHPGRRNVFGVDSILARVFSEMKGIIMDSAFHTRMKYNPFKEAGSDVFSIVSAWPNARVDLYMADAELIKEVTSARHRFPKPVSDYSILCFFGRNIVASEGEEWKKYRKVSAPAFTDKNNVLVWDETIRIVMDMIDNFWENKDEVVIDHCTDITLPIALKVIGVAGFGRRISWKEDAIVPAGHQMGFNDALHISSVDVGLKLVLPEWTLGLTERTRRVRLAYEELEKYMMEMIHNRKKQDAKVERHDLFSKLIEANDEAYLSPGEKPLSDQDLLGNVFIFFLAGHETTAHTLVFCFGLLALYPDEQEKLYQHIKSIIPGDEIPSYEKMPKFTQSLAVFYETLRKYPPVPIIPKISAEDTTIDTVDSAGEKMTIPIPKGTRLAISTPGLHYNPRYWPEPNAFKPERFLGAYPKDAFLPFSAGPRACIGRKFFETEGLAVLTILVSRYSIDLTEDFKKKYEDKTVAEKERILLKSRDGLSTTPVKVPLVFRRRK